MTIALLEQRRSWIARCKRLCWRLLEPGSVIAALALAALILCHGRDEAFHIILVGFATAGLVAWIVVQDLKTFTIADGSVVALASLAFADRWAAGDTVWAIGLDGILIGGLLFAFREVYYRCRGFDGLGLGDVKLAASGAVLIGAPAFAWALFFASLLTLCFVAASRIVVHIRRSGVALRDTDRLAFGAVLAPAIWVVWLAQHVGILQPFAGL